MRLFLRLTMLLITAVPSLFSERTPKVHIILTSAIIKNQFGLRMAEYTNSIEQLRKLGIEPWIVEATNIRSSFFDTISDQVFYPQQHDDTQRSNKGLNETRSIRACLPYLDFNDDDIVIKMTGRYFLKDRYFIDTILRTSNQYDAWGMYGKNFVASEHLFTGCFAMRWKYYKRYICEMDLEREATKITALEEISAKFIEENGLRFRQMDSLHLFARVFFGGETQPTNYEW